MSVLGDVDEKSALTEAFTFVRAPKNWRAIEAIAAELLENERLDGEEVYILVCVADGEAGPEVLERYRAMARQARTT